MNHEELTKLRQLLVDAAANVMKRKPDDAVDALAEAERIVIEAQDSVAQCEQAAVG